MSDIVDIGLKVDSSSVKKGTGALNRFGRQAGKTERATDKMKRSIKRAGLAFAAMGAAAAAAGAAFTFNKIRDFGKAISELSAITGATGKDLDFLRQKSLEFGRTTTLTASQAAEAFKLIASAKPSLLENARALAAVTKQAIILSEASGVTLAESANTVGSALNQFSANADQATRFVNVLAAGAKFGASEINQTSIALRKVGVVAAQAGLSFEQTNTAIQLLAKGALKGEEAGTGLRGVFLKLTTQANREFNPAIVGIEKALKNLAKAQLSDREQKKLFGQESIVAAKLLIKEADSFGTLTDKLTGTDTALEQAKINTNNLDGDLKLLKSAVEGAALSFEKDFNPQLRDMVKLFTNAASGFTIFIDKISGANTQLTLALKLREARDELKALQDKFREVENDPSLSSIFPEQAIIDQINRIANKIEKLNKLRNEIISPKSEQGIAAPSGAAPSGGAASGGAPQGPTPAEIKAAAAAQNIIDLTKAKFARMHELALEADATDSERAQLKLEFDLQQMQTDFDNLNLNETQKATLREQFEQARIERAQMTADKLGKIDADLEKKKIAAEKRLQAIQLQNASQLFGDLSSLMQTGSRKLFEIGKAAAIAQAVVNVAQGVTKALGQGGFFGIAMGAAVAAAGAVQIAKIASTQFNGGQGGSVAVGGASFASSGGGQQTATVPQSPAGQQIQRVTNVTLSIDSGGIYTGNEVRTLIEAINEQVGDGVKLAVNA